MRHSDPEGLYRALGVSPSADADEIKNAYRRLAKATHPDTRAEPSELDFHKIYDAYKILSDEDARARYDRRFAQEDGEYSWLGIHPVKCSRCDRTTAQPRVLTFERVYSFLFFSFRSPKSGVFCTRCAQSTAVKASFATAMFGWWAVPLAPFLTLRAIAGNALGGKRDLAAEEELLWQNSRAFAALGNRKLAFALASKLTGAKDPEIAAGADELVRDIEARGASRKKVRLRDPWRVKPLAAMTHLTLAAVLPLGIGGVALQALQNDETREGRTRALANLVLPVETATSSIPGVVEARKPASRGCWKEPENGEVLYRVNPRAARGHEIAIFNDTAKAAVVKLRSAFSKRLIAAMYVFPHASAALVGIPDGYYMVQYGFGGELDAGCVSFATAEGSWQFAGTESLRTIATGGAPLRLQYSLMADPSPGDAAIVSPALFSQN